MASTQALAPAADLERAPHAAPVDELVRSIGTDPVNGLSTTAAAERLTRYGANELAQAPPELWWKRFAGASAVVVVGPSRVRSPLLVDLIRGPRGGHKVPPWGDVLWDL